MNKEMHEWYGRKPLRLFLLVLMLAFVLGGRAQQNKNGFDPKRFQAEMEQYITEKAVLSPAQAAKFFPLFREMQRRQRALFRQMRKMQFVDSQDDKACEKAIAQMDENDMKMKMLQKEYHEKFLRVLPASKVLQVIKAEDEFHRQAFRRAFRGRPGLAPQR